ncbi:HlyD family efflux transporter periplasmic adaptor subunit [Cellulosilyticum sp. I15G10I2]|uniref:HlyD family efflux transporter periplasmic adaptor subunit n=1 Tax=Cellulosilyticum sp. I15G10I2 TaxID=1892843 RepID=UPI00085C20F3|nr:HlyD family efflux transporter periplasmic adaptor subunit [Cellulosilyticum sp. I15G10I2]
MNNNLKQHKTIDLHSTKRQRSSKSNKLEYFNPYTRESEYPATQSAYTPMVSPEVRKKQIKENNKLSKRDIRKNKRKDKLRFSVKIVLAMFITVTTVWGAISIKDMLTYPKVSYQIVKTGSIDNSKAFEGIIIREEKVYYSEKEGMMKTIIAEGEKVKKNGEVCVLINDPSLQQALEEKSKISHELYNAANKREKFSYYQDDLYQIDSSIKNTINTFYSERYKDTTEYIYSIRNELENNVSKRTKLYVNEQNTLGETVGQKLTTLNAEVSQMQYANKTEKSGIVSYGIDGAEERLTPQVIDTMSYSMFKDIRQESHQNLGNNTYISKGMPLYRIISDDRWYIVTYIDLEEGDAYKERQNYVLNFETGNRIQITFKLEKKIIEDNKIKLVFETNEQMDRFLNLRILDFSIGNRNEEGLKIPLQAIVEQNMLKIPSEYKIEKDGQLGVYRKNSDITEFVKIIPQYEKNDEIYILQEVGVRDAININDILYHPTTQATLKLGDIYTKEGVYVINGKLAQFKAIDVYLRNNEYALIKYTANNELKELDKIISNPKSIKRDQLLQHMNIQNE